MNNYNYKNDKKKNFAPNNRKSKEEYEAERQARFERQSKSLDVIDDIAYYMNDFLKNGSKYKVTMKEVLEYLNTEKGYTVEDTKVVSQFNYLMMDLCNARKNRNISNDRLNVRVAYIKERFNSSFRDELYERALGIMNKYDTLFHWSDEEENEYHNSEE